ncbi:MAG: YraN family protein [Chthoniobacteraceae bacterium]
MAPAHSIAARFRQWLSASFNSKPHDPRHELGRRGEDAAARFLKKQGYKVLYRNFRAPRGGEVDLVCRDKSCNTLVFVEVKTRTSEAYGQAAEAVNIGKQRLITRGALAWLRLLDQPEILSRFDVVEVYFEGGKPRFNLIQDAFPISDPYIS